MGGVVDGSSCPRLASVSPGLTSLGWAEDFHSAASRERGIKGNCSGGPEPGARGRPGGNPKPSQLFPVCRQLDCMEHAVRTAAHTSLSSFARPPCVLGMWLSFYLSLSLPISLSRGIKEIVEVFRPSKRAILCSSDPKLSASLHGTLTHPCWFREVALLPEEWP